MRLLFFSIHCYLDPSSVRLLGVGSYFVEIRTDTNNPDTNDPRFGKPASVDVTDARNRPGIGISHPAKPR